MPCQETPLEVMFSFFKGTFGVSHHALAGLILSSHPLPSGQTPVQMADNTSWLSRQVVHAAPDALQKRLFADFEASSRRVHARLNQLGNADTLIAEKIVLLEPRVASALVASGQDANLYANAFARFAATKVKDATRARMVLLLLIATCCSGSPVEAVRRAIACQAQGHANQVSSTPPSGRISEAITSEA